MRKRMIAVLAVLILSALGTASAQTPSQPNSPHATKQRPPAQTSRGNSILDRFVGTWTAAPAEVRLGSDFDISVWGRNASSVRKVQMTIQPSGEGSIKVTRSVVDGRGRPKPASVSVEQAKLILRAPQNPEPNRIEPIVDVQNAERKYPDSPNDCWLLDGLVVKLVVTDLEHDTVNLRFDLPDGRGSFGETLVRQTTRTARRPAR